MSDTEAKKESFTESKETTVILDGKVVTLAELNEAKAKILNVLFLMSQKTNIELFKCLEVK